MTNAYRKFINRCFTNAPKHHKKTPEQIRRDRKRREARDKEYDIAMDREIADLFKEVWDE